jgi:hypothetical protein
MPVRVGILQEQLPLIFVLGRRTRWSTGLAAGPGPWPRRLRHALRHRNSRAHVLPPGALGCVGRRCAAPVRQPKAIATGRAHAPASIAAATPTRSAQAPPPVTWSRTPMARNAAACIRRSHRQRAATRIARRSGPQGWNHAPSRLRHIPTTAPGRPEPRMPSGSPHHGRRYPRDELGRPAGRMSCGLPPHGARCCAVAAGLIAVPIPSGQPVL